MWFPKLVTHPEGGETGEGGEAGEGEGDAATADAVLVSGRSWYHIEVEEDPHLFLAREGTIHPGSSSVLPLRSLFPASPFNLRGSL